MKDQLAFWAVRCAVCDAREAEWVHQLDWERAQFRIYGKGHVWGSPIRLCSSCHDLLLAGDIEALVAVSRDTKGLMPRDLDEQVRNGIRALVHADLGARPIDETRPAGYRELLEQGFVPLEQMTGDLELAEVWPAKHRRGLPEPDAASAADLPGGQHWFVRSPWPAVPLVRLFGLIGRDSDRALRQRHGDAAWQIGPADHARKQAAIEALLASDERVIRRRLRLPANS